MELRALRFRRERRRFSARRCVAIIGALEEGNRVSKARRKKDRDFGSLLRQYKDES